MDTAHYDWPLADAQSEQSPVSGRPLPAGRRLTDRDRRQSAFQRARHSVEMAGLYFERFESALIWPPGMWLRPRGAALWSRYCRGFLGFGACGRRNTPIVDLAIGVCCLRNLARKGGLRRQWHIGALALLIVRREADARPLAIRPGDAGQVVDSFILNTEEGVCCE